MAALPALLAAALLAWLLFWPSPRLLCLFQRADLPARSPLSGLTLGALPAAGGMVVVTSLKSHGQAEQMGVRVGDVVTSVNGRTVHNLTGLRKILRSQPMPVISVRFHHGIGAYDVTLKQTVQACGDP